jgi:hypothetical protein
MAKKGMKKQALGWIPSSFDDADLKKAKREGFLSASVEDHLPKHRGYSFAAGGIPGDVPRFPSSRFFSSCPRISSWASVCVRRAAASAHAKLSASHCLLHHFMQSIFGH